eukprot:scaffold269_cov404-Prasinococcus_capsulatus_cf.AAC.5
MAVEAADGEAAAVTEGAAAEADGATREVQAPQEMAPAQPTETRTRKIGISARGTGSGPRSRCRRMVNIIDW